jgi:hypothetical protein
MASKDNRSSSLLYTIISGFFITAVLAIAIAGFFSYSHPVLTAKARTFIGRNTDSLSIGTLRVTPWLGVGLRDVRMVKTLKDGTSFRISAQRLYLGYRFFSTIFKLEKIASFASNPGLDSLLSEDGRALVTSVIRDFSARDLQVSIRISGRDAVKLSGCALRLESPRGTFKLRASVKQVDWHILRFEKVALGCNWEGDSLMVERFRARFNGGKIDGKATVDILNRSLSEAHCEVSGVDLAMFAGSLGSPAGAVNGEAGLRMKFGPSALSADSLDAEGSFSARDVNLQDVALLHSLVIALAVPALSHVTFDKINGDMVLAQGSLNCTDIRGQGAPVDITANGNVRLTGTILFDLNCVFPSEYKDSLPSLAWESLNPADDDGKSFQCSVYGPWDSPQLRIDRKVTERAVQNVIKKIGNGLKSLFNK